MYVLSFYDEAIVKATTDGSFEEFVERKNNLCLLARQNLETDETLCIFITGPAGAGKCELKTK
jgi:chromosomal replication initiation ATPase DnaA